MTMTTITSKPDRPPRPKDMAAITAWIGGETLTQAWRNHVATNPDTPNAKQAACNWARQPHIKWAIDEAREAYIAANYGDVSALLTAQIARFEAVIAAGMTMRKGMDGIERPESLAATVAAITGITKLFQMAQGVTANRLAMAKAWNELARDLAVAPEVREQVTTAILSRLA